jgi:radical SAM protein with 4Fe4S-binding SPASM domain
MGARPPCGGPFKTPVIHVDGTVTVCCKDVKFELALGNINENPFEAIWTNDFATEIRLAHILGNLESIPRCKDCMNLDNTFLSDEEIKAYLESIGRPELYRQYRKRLADD